MPRGAPSWRGASADAPGSGDPGPPGVIVRAVRRNPDNASSRRVTPLIARGVTPLIARGRKETGPPRARPKGGGNSARPSRRKNEIERRQRRSSPSPGGEGRPPERSEAKRRRSGWGEGESRFA